MHIYAHRLPKVPHYRIWMFIGYLRSRLRSCLPRISKAAYSRLSKNKDFSLQTRPEHLDNHVSVVYLSASNMSAGSFNVTNVTGTIVQGKNTSQPLSTDCPLYNDLAT